MISVYMPGNQQSPSVNDARIVQVCSAKEKVAFKKKRII